MSTLDQVPEQDYHWKKAGFDEVYDLPDPRGYFQALTPLAYQIPEHAEPVFHGLVDRWREQRGDDPTVMDLCCSYGINGTLLNHDIEYGELAEHYTAPEVETLDTAGLVRRDRAYLEPRRRPDAVQVFGLDASARAVAYAEEVGSLDRGFGENLEADDPTPELADCAARTDILTVTGGVGYITRRTFEHLLADGRTDRWVAAMVLRAIPYDPIAEVLAEHGLVTEKLTGRTFRQRRFADETEREEALRALAEEGIDPAGKEDTGYYHVDLYVSRPADEVADRPLEKALSTL